MTSLHELPPHPTGSEALDLVLGGGLPQASTTMVAGAPGTGKTVLAEQILFANASTEVSALYLTTLSEPLEKVVRYLRRFAFFDADRLPGAIHYEDIGETLRTEGLERLGPLIEDLVVEHEATFVVIDSFKALHDLAPNPAALRSLVFDLGRVFTSVGATALLLGEYATSEISSMPEFAVADGIVELVNRSHGVRDERTLRVHKLRGASCLRGEHSFRITQNGIELFPRLVGTTAAQAAWSEERVPTGIPGLDRLMNGGPWRGSAVLVAGPTGVGKTMLGLRFLLAGVELGEPGLLVCFQESPVRLRQVVRGFGADLEALESAGLIQVLYLSPLELDLVELFARMTVLMQSGNVRRLVVDALNDIEEAAIERGRFRAAVWSLVHHLGLSGITGVLLSETAQYGLEAIALSQAHINYLADCLVLLQYESSPQQDHDRTIQVLKTRASGHDSRPHAFRIGPLGPEVLEEPGG